MRTSVCRLFTLFLFCFFSDTFVWSQNLLRQPLQGINADSVIFLNKDQTNLRMAGVMGPTSAEPRSLPMMSRKDIKALLFTKQTTHQPTIEAPQSIYEGVNALQRNLPLLRWTGNSKYCDSLSDALFNQLMPALLTKSFEQHLAQQAVVDAVQWMYLTDDHGVWVNLYLNAFAHIVTHRFSLTIDQTSRTPFGSRVQMRIGGLKSQTPLELRLFIPSWQKTTPLIYVNGREEFCTIEKGYAVIRRKWNAGDEVFFDFDFSPRIERGLLRIGPLFFVPTAPPSLPVTMTERVNQNEHPVYQGGNFTAEPLMDHPLQP